MRFLRGVIGVSTLAPMLLVLSPGTALAAAPAHDNIANAKPVTIGFSEEIDTREATKEDFDDDCGAPAADATVWYSYTSPVGRDVVVDASRSDYSVRILIIPGPIDVFEEPICYSRKAGFSAEAGRTYFIMAMDDQADGTGYGGTLRIEFRKAPPPPTLTVTIDRVLPLNTRTGKATLRGTFACTHAPFRQLDVGVKQDLAPGVTVEAWANVFTLTGACDGTPRPWSTTTTPSWNNLKLTAGDAVAVLHGMACGVVTCVHVPAHVYPWMEQAVRLRARN